MRTLDVSVYQIETVNAQDNSGDTPLHDAARFGHIGMARPPEHMHTQYFYQSYTNMHT